MYIKITYVYEKDGVIGYACGYKPEGVEIIEERPVLYAEEGYELFRKSNGEDIGSAVWLKDGDVENNYEEKEVQE